jgi:hypothetical protein
VVGGVLVYCDPKTWPENPEKLNLPEGWFVAVGVHPKHALDFGDFYFDRLSRLLDSHWLMGTPTPTDQMGRRHWFQTKKRHRPRYRKPTSPRRRDP